MEGTLAARCPQLSRVTVWQSFPDMLASAPGFHDLAFLKEERGGSSCPLGSQVTRCPRLPRVGFRASEVPSGKCSPGLLTGETRCSWSLGPGQGRPPQKASARPQAHHETLQQSSCLRKINFRSRGNCISPPDRCASPRRSGVRFTQDGCTDNQRLLGRGGLLPDRA